MSDITDLVAMGDVNIDYVVKKDLTVSFPELQENGGIWWEEIEELPGGSALNICKFARKYGYSARVVGRIGADLAGDMVESWLDAEGIGHPGLWRGEGPTGKAIVLRDRRSVRLLVNNKHNANHELSTQDVDASREAILGARVLFVSGYCFRLADRPRYRAAAHAMALARERRRGRRPFVVFDVVPHRLYQTMALDELLHVAGGCDLLISEVSTMRRFLGRGHKDEEVTADMAKRTAEALEEHFERMILRFGFSGCDEHLVWDGPGGSMEVQQVDHGAAADKRGVGDDQAIRALRDFFDALPEGRRVRA